MAAIRKVRLITVSALVAGMLLSMAVLSQHPNGAVVSFLRKTVCAPDFAPEAFGTFHLVSLAVCICAAILAGVAAWRVGTESMTDHLVFAAGIVFFLLEWYKQIYHLYLVGNGTYDFTVFPFQFCSLPMYLCLAAPLTGKRVRQILNCFLALFGTVGGYLVMAYPALPSSLTMCVHTMLWHSLMIALGVWLLIAVPCGRSFTGDYLPAAGVFLAAFSVAAILNVLLRETSGGKINLYYMSPYHRIRFLIVRDVQEHFGWVAAVAVYLLLFLCAGALPLWILGRVLCRIRRKPEKTEKKPKKIRKSPCNS